MAQDDRAGWRKAPWSGLVLVCRKCAKRQGWRDVKGDLKAALKGSGRRRVRVVETGCLGVCPKRAVTVATSASLRRGQVFLLSAAPASDEATLAPANRDAEPA